MASGAVVAHVLAYRIAAPHTREELLAETGHAWFNASLLLALALTLVVLGFAARLLALRSALAGRTGPAWLFALLPPAAFTLQEHLERLFHEGAPTPAFLEPTFAVGLLLQLPFALAALVAARALLRCADALRRLLGCAPRPAVVAPLLRASLPAAAPAQRPLPPGGGQRAPPLLPLGR
ncbi:MAG: hypothetical protein ACRDON_06285 [Gaiellaceae bacterium]